MSVFSNCTKNFQTWAANLSEGRRPQYPGDLRPPLRQQCPPPRQHRRMRPQRRCLCEVHSENWYISHRIIWYLWQLLRCSVETLFNLEFDKVDKIMIHSFTLISNQFFQGSVDSAATTPCTSAARTSTGRRRRRRRWRRGWPRGRSWTSTTPSMLRSTSGSASPSTTLDAPPQNSRRSEQCLASGRGLFLLK